MGSTSSQKNCSACTSPAKILGVSECSDLAVIDIEGEDFPHLNWYAGEIVVGLPIYAAGFPLGDPEFTLLNGIVSKENTKGETSWSSVDHVIEHTALTHPGSSGGPVVTAEGQVVGIHFAGDAETEQHYAIASDVAQPLIEILRTGEDIDSIGINGAALRLSEDLTGIWVASVKSGSPADVAGIQGGDILTMMEGLVLATDGTLTDYCDILRSHEPGDVLSVEVIRFGTEEVLEGQLNGRPLEQSFSFAQELETGDGEEYVTYTDYVEVLDDTEALRIGLPVEWTDITGSPWEIDGEVVGAGIAAAANLDDFYDTWSESGVFFGASEMLALEFEEAGLLDREDYDFSGDCDYEGRFDYEDPLYTGLYDHYTNCGGSGTQFVILAAVPEDREFMVVVQIQVVSEADLDALDKIVDTFEVVGVLPSD